MRVERLLPPSPTISFNDVSYSSGIFDRVTRAVRDHSCDVPILGVSDRKEVSPKKVRPKIVRPKIIRPMDLIGLSDDSVLRDGLSEESLSEESPSEDNPTKDNPTDGYDWLSRRLRLEG